MADSIPSTLTAGESLSLSLAFADYLTSAGWALKWIIQGPGTTRVTVTATAETDAFRLKLSAANSLLLRGACPWQLWVSKADDSHLVDSGSLAVAAGLASTTPDERILAALEAALERLAQDDEAEVEIADRKIVFKDPAKVQAMIDVYRSRVRIQRGGSLFRTIPVRFGHV